MSSHSSTILSSYSSFQPSAWQIDNIATNSIPKYKLNLGRFPTPIHSFNTIDISDYGLNMWIKRDDLSSFDLSGNKVRKLEFLLADAIEKGHDSVITIGGLQSNHARATAVAARQLSLQPHLILRTQLPIEDVDITGNLLFNRMVGSKIYTVTPSAYAQVGSDNLVHQLSQQLIEQGSNPYSIPVGGSNTLGSFGYMETIKEIISFSDIQFDHIVFGCGSGGTAAGISIGAKLSGLGANIHAIGVCDSPKYFYDHIRSVAVELEIDFSKFGEPEEWCKIYNGQGLGYAKSSTDELEYLMNISKSTGVILDPVYSGKALYYFMKNIITDREIFLPGQKILFIHTGGTVGFYDKADQLLPLLNNDNNIQKLSYKQTR
eukprot:gene21294-27590_t